jgi:hypothetical protein
MHRLCRRNHDRLRPPAIGCPGDDVRQPAYRGHRNLGFLSLCFGRSLSACLLGIVFGGFWFQQPEIRMRPRRQKMAGSTVSTGFARPRIGVFAQNPLGKRNRELPLPKACLPADQHCMRQCRRQQSRQFGQPWQLPDAQLDLPQEGNATPEESGI